MFYLLCFLGSVAIMTDLIITLFESPEPNIILLVHLVEFGIIFGIGFLVYSRYKSKADDVIQLSETLEEVKELRQEFQTIFNSLFENTPCLIGVITPQFNYLMVNNEIARVAGKSKDDLLKDKCFINLGNGEICSDCPTKKAFLTKSVCRNIKSMIHITDKEVYAEVTAVPVLNKKGDAKYVIEIARDVTDQVLAEKSKENLFIQTITSLSKLIEKRDNAIGAHSERVENIAVSIGKSMGLPKETLKDLSIAALLHDIGKIGISETVLNKPGKLNDAEYALVRNHTILGHEAIINIEPLKNIAESILHHHEKFDGTGYPNQLKGNEIPLISRIITIADAWDTLIYDRPYRKAYPEKEAMQMMLEECGSRFDPSVFLQFLKVICASNEQLNSVVARIKEDAKRGC